MVKDQDGGAGFTREIDAKIAALTDWRGAALARMRDLIRQADLDILEDVKWRHALQCDVRGVGVGA